MQFGWRARRALYQAHLWIGIALALPLLLAALTGTVLLFKFDLVRSFVPAAAQSIQLSPAQIGAAAEEIEQTFGTSLRSLRLPDDRIGVIEIYLTNDDAAYFDTVTHRVVRRWNRHRDPLDLLFEIHHELFAGETGRTILGVVALAGIALLLIGLTLWLSPRRPFRISLIPRGRPSVLASHRDLGVLICVPLLLTFLSGAVLAFPNGSRAFLDAVLPGQANASKPPSASPGNVDWHRAVAAASAALPSATIRMLVWPAKPGAPASLRLRQPAEAHPNGRTSVYIDPATNEVLAVRDALVEPIGTQVANFAYPLHAATIGRAWWRWVLLASGIGTLLVASYGVVAWWKKS